MVQHNRANELQLVKYWHVKMTLYLCLTCVELDSMYGVDTHTFVSSTYRERKKNNFFNWT